MPEVENVVVAVRNVLTILIDGWKSVVAVGSTLPSRVKARARLLPRTCWVALGVSVLLLLLPVVFRLDGKAHADWQQFLGRFHPLVVHLPVGLILLVPVLELMGWLRRPALREAASFGLISCFAALTLGYLLAYGSGASGAGVSRHMWGGIWLTIAVLACVLVRPAWQAHTPTEPSSQMPAPTLTNWLYPGMLACVVLLLSWAAHQGGSLTHGSNYLTEFMPSPLKKLSSLGSSSSPTGGSFYVKHIHPILDANCVVCHGESKVKGGLRVDTYEQLMRGGKDGAVIVAGNPGNSMLLQRVTLPVSHKQFMPAEGKPPLKPEEIAWIRAWIEQGASPTVTSLKGISIREDAPEVPLVPVADYTSLLPEIQQMAKSQGAKLVPVSAKMSDGLVLQTVDISGSFNDAQLAKFAKFAPYIVEVELSRTAVTNACFDTLAKFPHLRAVHLDDTAITGDGLAKLASLSELTYINLSSTKVTQASIAPLNAMKSLRHIYLYNTPAQPIPTAVAAVPAPAASTLPRSTP